MCLKGINGFEVFKGYDTIVGWRGRRIMSQTASIYSSTHLFICTSGHELIFLLIPYISLVLPSVLPNGSPDQTRPNRPIRFAGQRAKCLVASRSGTFRCVESMTPQRRQRSGSADL